MKKEEEEDKPVSKLVKECAELEKQARKFQEDLQNHLLAVEAAQPSSEKNRQQARVDELQGEVRKHISCQITVNGARGSGKSTLWNALLLKGAPIADNVGLKTEHASQAAYVPAQRYRTKPRERPTSVHQLRLLPSRPFGTCSAVPVDIERCPLTNQKPGEDDTVADTSTLRVELHLDTDFLKYVREHKNQPSDESEDDAPVPDMRLRAALQINSKLVENLDSDDQPGIIVLPCDDYTSVRNVLREHCTLPVTDEGSAASMWSVLSHARVLGPFTDDVLLPGCFLTDSPGFGDGSSPSKVHHERALQDSYAIICVVEASQLLTEASVEAVIKAFTYCQLQDNVCVAVTKFMDKQDQTREELEDCICDHFGVSVSSQETVNELRNQLFELVRDRFVDMLLAANTQHTLPERDVLRTRVLRVSPLLYLTLGGDSDVSHGIHRLREWMESRLVAARRDLFAQWSADLQSGPEQSLMDYDLLRQAVREAATATEEAALASLKAMQFHSLDLEGILKRSVTFAHGGKSRSFFSSTSPTTRATALVNTMLLQVCRAWQQTGPPKISETPRFHVVNCPPQFLRDLNNEFLGFPVTLLDLFFEAAVERIVSLEQEYASSRGSTWAKPAFLQRLAAHLRGISSTNDAFLQAARAYAKNALEKCLHAISVREQSNLAQGAGAVLMNTPASQFRFLKGWQRKSTFFGGVTLAVSTLAPSTSEYCMPLRRKCAYSNIELALECQQHAGYVYILHNPSFRKNYLKIGKTTCDPRDRVKALDTTGVPGQFQIVAFFQVSHVHLYECLAHNLLRRSRLDTAREFFCLPSAPAKDIVAAICSVKFDH